MTDSQLSHFTQTLQQSGYRMTNARRAIIETLLASGAHLSADQLVALVHENTPSVGRMTVYRTLELLCELGLVRTVYQGTGAAHYILLEGGHHHHLVCDQCHAVVEFDECALGGLGKELEQRFGFQIEGHLVEFYGVCPACQEKSTAV